MKRLTNSEMASWRGCKRQWYLGVYRGLQRKGAHRFNSPLSIGSRVHDALEIYYDPTTGLRNPVETCKASCEQDIIDYPEKETDIRKEMDLCVAMLEGYIEWLAEEGADSTLHVIESEKAREAILIDGQATLLAKLDARVEDLGLAYSLEHKTGMMGVEPGVLQMNTQLLTQHLVEYLAKKQAGESTENSWGVLINYLKKSKRTERAKGPFYWRDKIHHNKTELESHWLHVKAIADEILEAERKLGAGESHHTVCHPSPSGDCRWKCSFYSICSLHDDGSDVEAAIEDLYETHDPLERYALPDRMDQ